MIRYLVGATDVEPGVYEIGGADVTTYREMIAAYAIARGLRRRRIIDVPYLTPRLSSYWLDLVTPVDRRVSHALVESLVTEVIVRDRARTDAAFGIEPIGLADALAVALDDQARALDHELLSRETASATACTPFASTSRSPTRRRRGLDADLDRIGGSYRWYGLPLAWRTRALLGRLVGERWNLDRAASDRTGRDRRLVAASPGAIPGTLVLRSISTGSPEKAGSAIASASTNSSRSAPCARRESPDSSTGRRCNRCTGASSGRSPVTGSHAPPIEGRPRRTKGGARSHIGGEAMVRSRRISPTSRTTVLCAMGLVGGLIMVIALTVTVRGTNAVARESATRAIPAQTALRDTLAASSGGQESLLALLQSQDAATRATSLTAAQQSGQLQSSAWAEYLRHALGAPGEAVLQRSYEAAAAQAVKLAADLLGTAPTDPTFAAKLASERREVANEVAALMSLESTIYDPAIRGHANKIVSGINDARNVEYLTYASLALVFAAVGLTMMRGARRDEQKMRTDATTMKAAVEFGKLDTSLQRALDMQRTEDAACDVIEQALTLVAPDVPTELLLAGSSHAHFRQVFSTDPGADGACRVAAPEECPATMSGQTQVFADSSHLDTCPYLRGRDDPVWATCVPLTIAGRATGVLHAQRALEFPPGDVIRAWELVGRKAGERIGMLRAFARSEIQAETDPLTGLLNRRSLEERTRGLVDSGLPYVIAYGDLDQFKLLNDVHGHDTGDRALRLFAARVARQRAPERHPRPLRRRRVRRRAPRLHDRECRRRHRTHQVATRLRAHERDAPPVHRQLRCRRVRDRDLVQPDPRRGRSRRSSRRSARVAIAWSSTVCRPNATRSPSIASTMPTTRPQPSKRPADRAEPLAS